MARTLSASGYNVSPLPPAEIQKLAEHLTPEERDVILFQGTEPPFCGGLLKQKTKGNYLCRLCSLPLFKSETKFESGTGWPSFFAPFDPDHILEIKDTSHGMTRVEIRCKRCSGHLGHVFPDGPKPTGMRYCLNSASLQFEEGQDKPASA